MLPNLPNADEAPEIAVFLADMSHPDVQQYEAAQMGPAFRWARSQGCRFFASVTAPRFLLQRALADENEVRCFLYEVAERVEATRLRSAVFLDDVFLTKLAAELRAAQGCVVCVAAPAGMQ